MNMNSMPSSFAHKSDIIFYFNLIAFHFKSVVSANLWINCLRIAQLLTGICCHAFFQFRKKPKQNSAVLEFHSSGKNRVSANYSNSTSVGFINHVTVLNLFLHLQR